MSLENVSARDEAVRELRSFQQQKTSLGREFSFINSEQTFFNGSPNSNQTNQATSLQLAQGQNSYSIIEIELEENLRNQKANAVGVRKLPIIDSIEQKLHQKRKASNSNSGCSSSEPEKTPAGQNCGDVTVSRKTSNFEELRKTKKEFANFVSNELSSMTSAKALQSAETFFASKPVGIRDFYLFSKGKQIKSFPRNEEVDQITIPKEIKNSKCKKKKNREKKTEKKTTKSSEFSNLQIADLFSTYKPEAKFSFDTTDESSMQNM